MRHEIVCNFVKKSLGCKLNNILFNKDDNDWATGHAYTSPLPFVFGLSYMAAIPIYSTLYTEASVMEYIGSADR